MRYFFLFFVLIPFVEIFLFIVVSHEIGTLITISLVLFTASVGIFFLRKQGLRILFRAREKINIGEIPAKEMLEAVIITFGGVFLIIPGFATDFLGFIGLVPALRAYLLPNFATKFFVKTYGQNFSQSNTDDLSKNIPNNDQEIIDAEYWTEQERK